MTNYAVWDAFKRLFPEKKIQKFYTTRNENTITLEDKDHKRYSFTYNGPDSWRLQTITL